MGLDYFFVFHKTRIMMKIFEFTEQLPSESSCRDDFKLQREKEGVFLKKYNNSFGIETYLDEFCTNLIGVTLVIRFLIE